VTGLLTGRELGGIEEHLQGFVNVVFLTMAIFTCLALGVVMAYGACNLMFACLRMRPRISPAAAVPGKVAGTAKV
jgi:nitrate reductase NapE component